MTRLHGSLAVCTGFSAGGEEHPVRIEDEDTLTITRTTSELLSGLRHPGNGIIWRDFVDRYWPVIVGYACRRGLSEQDAQDTAQETLAAFSTAYQAGKYDRDKGRLRKWMFGIAHKQTMNCLRRRARAGVQVAREGSGTGFFDDVSIEDPHEAAWEQEWQACIMKQCMREVGARFSSEMVQAFNLFAVQGIPAQEVADRLGMSRNAVYLTKHKILKVISSLRAKIEDA